MNLAFCLLLCSILSTISLSAMNENGDVAAHITEKKYNFFQKFFYNYPEKEIIMWIKHSPLYYINAYIKNSSLRICCATRDDGVIANLKNTDYQCTILGEKYTELLSKNNLSYITFHLTLKNGNDARTVCENIFSQEPKLSSEVKESFITKLLNLPIK